MNDRSTTTLLLPTLNEIEAVRVIAPQIKREWVDEVIVIDGGSTDGTVDFMQSQGFQVYTQERRGFGQGMLQGMHIARGEIVIEFMPDGNALPADIPRIIEKMREGYDLVVGSRYYDGAKSEDDDWLTSIGNSMFTLIVNVLFRAHYTDVLNGFRAYRRSAALPLKLDATGLGWPCQSSVRFARAGLRVGEIFTHEPPRIGGVRKMKPLKTGWEICMLILRDFLWFRPGRNVA